MCMNEQLQNMTKLVPNLIQKHHPQQFLILEGMDLIIFPKDVPSMTLFTYFLLG